MSGSCTRSIQRRVLSIFVTVSLLLLTFLQNVSSLPYQSTVFAAPYAQAGDVGLAGTLESPAGTPVANASGTLSLYSSCFSSYPYYSTQFTTDAQGIYRLMLPANLTGRSYRLQFTFDDPQVATATPSGQWHGTNATSCNTAGAVFLNPGPMSLTTVLGQGLTFAGTLRDTASNPIANTTGTVILSNPNDTYEHMYGGSSNRTSSYRNHTYTITTDASGNFSIPTAVLDDTGVSTEIIVYGYQQATELVASFAPPYTPGTYTLTPGAVLNGSLENNHGHPISNTAGTIALYDDATCTSYTTENFQTDQNGNYFITVAPGLYRLQFNFDDPQVQAATPSGQWHANGALTCSQASTVDISNMGDANLPLYTQINQGLTFKLVDSVTNEPIKQTNGRVTFDPVNDTYTYDAGTDTATPTRSNASHTYHIRTDDDGTFDTAALPDTNISYNLDGFLGYEPKSGTLQEISATAYEIRINPAVALRGHIVDSVTGAPIANTPGMITFKPEGAGEWNQPITTDDNGYYTQTLAIGNYQLGFSFFGINPNQYPAQWHDDGKGWITDGGDSVRLAPSGQPNNIVELTTHLAPGSRIQGTITDAARQALITESSSFDIEYSHANDSSKTGTIFGVQLDAQGNFITTERLLPGSYRLRFIGVNGYVDGQAAQRPNRETYHNAYHNNQTLFGATVVNVPGDGKDVTVHTSLNPYITLIGTIAAKDTAEPFINTNTPGNYNASIRLYDKNGTDKTSWTNIDTDNTGTYTVTFIANDPDPAKYAVKFDLSNGPRTYDQQYHGANGSNNIADAELVELDYGNNYLDSLLVDTQKADTFFLGRLVNGHTDTPIVNTTIAGFTQRYDPQTSSWEGTKPFGPITVDASGQYTITGLVSGTHQLAFGMLPAGYPASFTTPQYYNDGKHEDNANNIQMDSTITPPVVDTKVRPATTFVGLLQDAQTTTPITETNITVSFEREDGRAYPCSTTTDASGVYTCTNLLRGTYILGYTSIQNYPMPQYHDEGVSYANATPVDIAQNDAPAAVTSRVQPYATFIGRVVDDITGTPLANTSFGLTFYRQGSTGSGTPFAGTTDAAGEFTISNVIPHGDYTIEFTSIGGDYPNQYYNKGATKKEAEVVTIAPGVPSSSLEMRVVPNATFKGILHDEITGQVLANTNMCVQLHPTDGSLSVGPLCYKTDVNGTYTVTGLLEGSYFIEYTYVQSYPTPQYHDYGADEQKATAVSVAVTSNPAPVISHIRPYASWDGELRDSATGNPITYAEGWMRFYPIDPETDKPKTDQFGAPIYDQIPIRTDDEGKYSVAQKSGIYLIRLSDFDDEGYKEQYHRDQRDAPCQEKFRQDDAQHVQLDPGKRATLLTTWLDPPVELRGTLVDAVSGEKLAYTSASLLFDGSCSDTGITEAIETDKDGTFTIVRNTDLCGYDDYIVKLSNIDRSNYPFMYPPQYYDNGHMDPNNANDLRLYPGTNDVTFSLAPGSVVTGIVYDANTGKPLAKQTIDVTFMDVAGNPMSYLGTFGTLSLTTDDNGVYTTRKPYGGTPGYDHLLPGPYKAKFTAQGYQDRYYGGEDAPWTAGVFMVPGNGDPAKVNIALKPVGEDLSASLDGTLLNTLNGSPIANITATVQLKGQHTGFVKNVKIITDQNGNYRVPGLVIDTYTILFSDIHDNNGTNQFADQYHNDGQMAFDAYGIPVRLVPGSQLTSHLAPGSRLTGTITDATTGKVITDTAQLVQMVCQDKVDIVFVLDGSGSINATDFDKMRTFVREFINSYALGPSAANIGIVQFSSSGSVKIESSLTDDAQALNDAIAKMIQINGMTDIGEGLQRANKLLSAGRITSDPKVKQVVVLLTDGVHNGSINPLAEATTLKQNNATILGIAVGSGPDMSQINEIASDPDDEHVFALDNFDDLAIFLDSIVNATCSVNLPVPFKVFVYRADTNELADALPYEAVINTQGTYVTTRRVLPGTYRLRFMDVSGHMNGMLTDYTDRYHDNRIFLDPDTTLVSVPNNGNDVVVDTMLDPYISLVGKLLGPDGQPITATVDIALQSSLDSSIINLGNFDLDKTGTYTIPNSRKIEPGSYAIRFNIVPEPGVPDLPMQWHNNGKRRENAEFVDLLGATTLTTNLVDGVSLHGTLTDAVRGTLIANSKEFTFTIYVYEAHNGPDSPYTELHAKTDKNGTYTSTEKLMPGEYMFRFADVIAPLNGQEWLEHYTDRFINSSNDGVKEFEKAHLFTVQPDANQFFILDIALDPYATYKGRLIDMQSGNPVVRRARTCCPPDPKAWVTFNDARKTWIRVDTDDDGNFTITSEAGIESGTYTLLFDVEEGYGWQYHNQGKVFADEADTVTLVAGDNNRVTTELKPYSSLHATFYDSSPSKPVLAYRNLQVTFKTPSGRVIGASNRPFTTDENGQYLFEGLPTGVYHLEFNLNENEHGYTSQWYNNGQSSLTSSDPVTITLGANNQINVYLARSQATGAIVDASSATPVDYATGWIKLKSHEQSIFEEEITTNQDGFFALSKTLPLTGTFDLCIEGFTDEGYPDQCVGNVTPQKGMNHFDMSVHPFVSLEGVLHDAYDDSLMPYASAHLRFKGKDIKGGTVNQLAAINTDNNGYFTLDTQIIPGNYTIELSNIDRYTEQAGNPDNSFLYPPQYYNEDDDGGESDPGNADVVSFEAGMNSLGPIHLERGTVLSGLLSDAEGVQPITSPYSFDPQNNLIGCSEQIDVMLILDGSQSITQEDFKKMKDFAGDIVQSFEMRPGWARVGIVQFGLDAKIEAPLSYNAASLLQTLDTMSQLQGYETDLVTALKTTHDTLAANKRPDAAQVMILITDGKHNQTGDPVRTANTIKADGMGIFTIGVGSGPDMNQLRSIASDPDNDHVYTVDNFSALPSVLQPLIVRTCATRNYGQTTQTNVVGCSSRLDVMLVLDGSGSISTNDFGLMQSFAEKIVDNLSVVPGGSRVGLVQFSGNAQLETGLSDDQQTVKDTINNMNQINGMTDIGDGLRVAQQEFVNNPRSGVAQIVILLTDGYHNGSVDPIAMADEMKSEGMYIFGIAVGLSDLQQIEAISSDPASQYVFSVNAFDALDSILQTLVTRTCTVLSTSGLGLRIKYFNTSDELLGDYQVLVDKDGKYSTRTVVPFGGAPGEDRLLPGTYKLMYVYTGYHDRFYDDDDYIWNAATLTIPGGTSWKDEQTVNMSLLSKRMIVGTVRDAKTGNLITDEYINAYFYNPDMGTTFERETFIDHTGTYTITMIPRGTYEVRFELPELLSYAPNWYNNKGGVVEADQLEVRDTMVVRVNLDFQPIGGSLTVKALDEGTTTTVSGVSVNLYHNGSSMPLYTGTTKKDGSILFNNIIPGSYAIEFLHHQYKPIFYGGKGSLALSDKVNVAQNDTVSVEQSLTRLRVMQVRLKDSTGKLINTTDMHVVMYDAFTGSLLHQGTTATGIYSATLLPGTYKVFVNGYGYIGQWYDNVVGETPVSMNPATTPSMGIYDPRFGMATPIDLNTPQPKTLDITMSRLQGPGSFTGQVTRDDIGAPLINARVEIYEAFDPASANQPVIVAFTDRQGKYTIDNVLAGLYKVRFVCDDNYRWTASPCSAAFVDPLTPEYYDDVLTMEAAQTFTVGTSTPDHTADAALAMGGRVGVVVLADDTSLPLSGARVMLKNQALNIVYSGWTQAHKYSDTAIDATVGAILEVPAGTYEVTVDAVGKYMGYTSKTIYTVEIGGRTNIEIRLKRGATLTGRITDDTSGLPLVDAQVSFYRNDFEAPFHMYNQDDTYDSTTTTARTDSMGYYIFTGVTTETRRLRFNAIGHTPEFFDNSPTWAGASQITVAPGTEETRDASLARRAVGSIHGTVTLPTHKGGAPGVKVCIYHELTMDLVNNCETKTDWLGMYAYSNLDAGNYLVQFIPPQDRGYAIEWFDDTYSSSTAKAISVAAGTSSQADAELNPATGSISGQVVTDDTNAPLAKVTVSAYRTDTGDFAGSATTNKDGNYHITALPDTSYAVFASSQGIYSGHWYEGQIHQSEADPVSVSSGGETADINFSLFVAGIQGYIFDEDGKPLPDIIVEAFPSGGFGESTSGGWAETDDQGFYSIPGLAAGFYYIAANAQRPDHQHLATTWYSTPESTTDRELAEAVEVNINGLTPADIVMHKKASLHGTVTGETDGTPQKGITIHLIPTLSGSTLVTITDVAGSYNFHNIAPGEYRLYLDPPETGSSNIYPDQWYDRVADKSLATPLVLPSGQNIQQDIQLARKPVAKRIYQPAMSADTTTKTGKPGTLIPYTLAVTNTGNVIDSYTFSAESAWLVVLPGDTPELAAGARTSVNVMVYIPLDETVGMSDTAIIKIASNNAISSTKSVSLTTIVGKDYNLSVTSDRTVGVALKRGEKVSYKLSVSNIGNVPDQYDITINGNIWQTDVSQTTVPNTGTLGVLQSSQVQVDVTVGMTNSIDTARATITSRGDPTKSMSLTLKTAVVSAETEGLRIEPALSEQKGKPGEQATHNFRVTNTVSETQTFVASVAQDIFSATLQLSPTFTLNGGEAITVPLNIRIPTDAQDGLADVALITVRSQQVISREVTAAASTLVATKEAGFTLTPEADTRVGTSGGVVSYTLEINNLANNSNSYLVKTEGNQWTTIAPERIQAVAGKSSRQMLVYVVIPPDDPTQTSGISTTDSLSDTVEIEVRPQEELTLRAKSILTTESVLKDSVVEEFDGNSSHTFTSAEGLFIVEIPAGAFNGKVQMRMTRVTSPTHADKLKAKFFRGYFLRFTGEDGKVVYKFNKPIKVKCKYTDGQLLDADISEGGLSFWELIMKTPSANIASLQQANEDVSWAQKEDAVKDSGNNSVELAITGTQPDGSTFVLASTETTLYLPMIMRAEAEAVPPAE